MRYGNTDSFLEKFPLDPVMKSMEMDWLRMETDYRSAVVFLLKPIKIIPEDERLLKTRIDDIVKLLSTSLSKEQIKDNKEWIWFHVNCDDINKCYNNYTKEYQKLETIAMRYLQFNDAGDELEKFTNSKNLNTILGQLCNIRYRKSILEEYLNEPPDLA